MSKAHISLDGSEHRDVYLKLKKSGDVNEEGSEDRLADLIFDGDGQKISLKMMESDARALGVFLLKNTSHSLGGFDNSIGDFLAKEHRTGGIFAR